MMKGFRNRRILTRKIRSSKSFPLAGFGTCGKMQKRNCHFYLPINRS
jgi:hypothetical protein